MTSSNRPPHPRHDRGAVSLLFIAVLVMCSLALMGIGNVVEVHRLDGETRTAAEAVALAVSLGASVDVLIESYDLDSFTIARDLRTVTVRVWRRGATAEATAFDHRRTIDPAK